MANPVGYTDLRTLIDIDPPQFDYHKSLVSREALINFSVHAVAKYMNHSTYLEVFMDLKDRDRKAFVPFSFENMLDLMATC